MKSPRRTRQRSMGARASATTSGKSGASDKRACSRTVNVSEPERRRYVGAQSPAASHFRQVPRSFWRGVMSGTAQTTQLDRYNCVTRSTSVGPKCTLRELLDEQADGGEQTAPSASFRFRVRRAPEPPEGARTGARGGRAPQAVASDAPERGWGCISMVVSPLVASTGSFRATPPEPASRLDTSAGAGAAGACQGSLAPGPHQGSGVRGPVGIAVRSRLPVGDTCKVTMVAPLLWS
mmetsp:Transcript_3906/g.7892  ORF Transcript_3906/g.7892 Transcript_3906/m.7892 type:complete len:236 (-) Transcript_3906:241-948(-)